MSTFTQFNFVEKSIRVSIDENGNPLFVAKDVCEILDQPDTSKVCSRLDDDEKLLRTVCVSGQNREILFVNESGLYAIIMTSRKPEAKKFRKWVTNEVLPSIRKTGKYEVPNFVQPEPTQNQTAEQISREQLNQIESLVNQISMCCHTHKSASWACYAFIRETYGVENAHKLPAVHFDRVYGALHVMSEKAHKYLRMRVEADGIFIKNVLRQNQIGFEVNQQLLLPN
jgi:prophage antirepressor-like protein